MRISPLLAMPIICVAASPVAVADDPIDCREPSATVEINFCADKHYAASDAKLNALYQKVLAQISTSGVEKPYDSASWEEAMRASQRAWVAFRDADCKGAVPMEWSGGSGTSAAVLGCMTTMTDARTEDLKERYNVE